MPVVDEGSAVNWVQGAAALEGFVGVCGTVCLLLEGKECRFCVSKGVPRTFWVSANT